MRCLRTRGAAAPSASARFLLRSRERWCFDSGRRGGCGRWTWAGRVRVVAEASTCGRPIAKWGKWRQSRWHRRLKKEKRSNRKGALLQVICTLRSTIVGKRLREMPPAGRAKLRRAITVPFLDKSAPLST